MTDARANQMMLRRLLASLLFACALSATSAHAQSTISTGAPATNSNLNSLVVRQLALAAASDINGILGMHAASSLGACPSSPYVGTDCLVVGSPIDSWYKWSGTGGWSLVGTINSSTGIFAPLSSANLVTNNPITSSFSGGVTTLGFNYGYAGTFTATQTIAPSAGTLTQGLLVNQTGPSSGSNAGPFSYNLINVTHLSTTTGSGLDAFGIDNTNSSAFRVNLTTGGTNISGQAVSAGLFALGVTDGNLGASAPDFVALTSVAYSNVTGTSSGHGLYGFVPYVFCDTSCTIAHLVGEEIDVGDNGAATVRAALRLVVNNGTGVGSTLDCAICFANISNSGTGAFQKLFALTQQNGFNAVPLSTSGDFFYSDTSQTVANIFNLSNITVSGNILNFPNVLLTGSGALVLDNATGGSQGAGTVNAIGYYINGAALATVNSVNSTLSLSGGVLGVNLANANIWTATITETINANNPTQMVLNNNSTGTSAITDFAANNSANQAAFGIGGTGYTVYTILQNRAFVSGSSGTSGIVLFNPGAAPTLFTVSAVEVGRFDSSTPGQLDLGVSATLGGALLLYGSSSGNSIVKAPATGGGTATLFVGSDTIAGKTVANGGTNCSAASGTCLDNITGFSSTGIVNRTGSGTYSFTSPGTGVLTAIALGVNTNGGIMTASTASIAAGALNVGTGSGTATGGVADVATGALLAAGGVGTNPNYCTACAISGSLALGGATIGGNAFAVTGSSLHTGTVTVTSANADALAVGPNGTTNPTLQVNTATASAATGLDIVGAAAGSGLALSVISSGTNENLTLDAKGSGTITLAGVSTGVVYIKQVLGGGTHFSTFGNALDLSGSGSSPEMVFSLVNGASIGAFAPTMLSLFGTNDVFFSLNPPTSAGYGILECYTCTGMAISSGSGPVPISIRPNRTVQMAITSGVQIYNAGSAPTGGDEGSGTLNVANAYYQNGTIGVTCSGTPTSSFASKLGIVTHC